MEPLVMMFSSSFLLLAALLKMHCSALPVGDTGCSSCNSATLQAMQKHSVLT